MKKGLLIILSGPSGVGKGTVRKYIMNRELFPMVFSVSMTTREPRATETNGVEYYFVSKEEFQRNIDNDNFLEWAEFVGNRYGTPRSIVEDLRNQGKNVLLEIEINGAEQVLSKVKDDRVVSFYLNNLKSVLERENLRLKKSSKSALLKRKRKWQKLRIMISL